jgi:hypothetical protein
VTAATTYYTAKGVVGVNQAATGFIAQQKRDDAQSAESPQPLQLQGSHAARSVSACHHTYNLDFSQSLVKRLFLDAKFVL